MTKEEKIKVVEYAIARLYFMDEPGLYMAICPSLTEGISFVMKQRCKSRSELVDFIPEFKEINKKYNPVPNSDYSLWFPLNKENYQKRLDILNELIELIKKGE